MSQQPNEAGATTSHPSTSKSENMENAKAALQNWIDVMKTKVPDDVVALYADDATFWGTMASSLSHDKASIKAYFVDFLQKDNLDIKVIDGVVQSSNSDEETIYSGSYNFSYTDNNGTDIMIPARFTFIFKLHSDGRWLIKHHHSSMTPVK